MRETVAFGDVIGYFRVVTRVCVRREQRDNHRVLTSRLGYLTLERLIMERKERNDYMVK